MSEPGRQQPRLQHVADLVGVSKATVSNAMNGTGRVSEATRSRVLEAARTLGHAPSTTSHARGRGNRGILGLTMATYGAALVDYTLIPYYAQLILGATATATQRGWLLVVLPGTMSSWSWLTVPVDGVIHSEPTVTDPVLAILRQRGIPTVTDGRPVRARAGDAWVDTDHEEATRALLEHLRACGSRRVGILLPRHEDAYPQLVRDAYLRWCVGRQDPVIAQFDPIPQYDVAERAAARSLLAQPDPPDAVIGLYNDSGRHVLDVANSLGRSVPDDLRVACFSEDADYGYSDPSVTTVSFQPRLLAAEAVDLLVGLVNGRRGLRRQRIVPSVLHIRCSTAGSAARHG